jgi:hypothetical protein
MGTTKETANEEKKESGLREAPGKREESGWREESGRHEEPNSTCPSRSD